MTEIEQDERYPLRGTVLQYIDPMSPVAEEDWEVLQPDASLDPTDRKPYTGEIQAGGDPPERAE